jgi:hypothetical protein
VTALRLLIALIAIALTGTAAAEIVVVTRAHGAIESLTREEAEQLYLGRLSALRDGTPVKLLDLPSGPIRDAFYAALIGKNAAQTRAYWSRMVFTGRARPPREVLDVEQMREQLRSDPGFIGYLPSAEVDADLRVLVRLP